jgi:peptidyl-prolyl cis-trans isomerase B (cyclophilin B)
VLDWSPLIGFREALSTKGCLVVVIQEDGTRPGAGRAWVGAVVAALVVIGAFLYVAFGGNSDKPTTSTASKPAPAAVASGSTAAGATGACAWRPDTTGNPNLKKTGLPPTSGYPTTGTEAMTMNTSQGTIVITLDVAHAPCSAASFAYLASKKFFNGTVCHRLVNGGIYVLQCGDPAGNGSGGPEYTIPDENLPAAGSGYGTGVVAIANTGQPGTGSSQFFLVFKDSSAGLAPSYSVIGKVTTGLDVLQKIGAAGVVGGGGDGAPKLTTKITTLTVGN